MPKSIELNEMNNLIRQVRLALQPGQHISSKDLQKKTNIEMETLYMTKREMIRRGALSQRRRKEGSYLLTLHDPVLPFEQRKDYPRRYGKEWKYPQAQCAYEKHRQSIDSELQRAKRIASKATLKLAIPEIEVKSGEPKPDERKHRVWVLVHAAPKLDIAPGKYTAEELRAFAESAGEGVLSLQIEGGTYSAPELRSLARQVMSMLTTGNE